MTGRGDFSTSTMKTTIWFRDHSARDRRREEDMIGAVSRCGITLAPAQENPPIGAGLVLFDRADSELCEALSRDSRHGFDRVLAVATHSEALAAGAVWRLLEAGAADVFAWDALPDPAATVAARFARYARVDELLQSPAVTDSLAGMSPAWLSALHSNRA